MPTVIERNGRVYRHETKPRYDLVPVEALKRWAQTMTEGAARYGDNNWRAMVHDHQFITDCFNHAVDHIYAHVAGDRSEDHLAHAIANLGLLIVHDEQATPEQGPAPDVPVAVKSVFGPE